MGAILLMLGKISEGTEYLKQEMQIYTELWKDAPEKPEAKYQEIAKFISTSRNLKLHKDFCPISSIDNFKPA